MRFRASSFRGSLVLAVLVAAPAVGCGREAIATTDALPVQRVVIYRNGVAYFERSGHVDRDEVRFKMKQSEVGDFLATLAVMERGGSSVRAAAFPIKVDDDDATQQPGEDGSVTPPQKPRERTEDEKKGLETVVLSLDGHEHDLQVGYVAESPVWKPSYRLVVHSDGDAELQAWGIVENLSGEDWKNVKLSLIAGAPLAFQAALGVPVIPPRPVVTDEGEVIAAVPHGETSLEQESQAPAAPPSAASADKPPGGMPTSPRPKNDPRGTQKASRPQMNLQEGGEGGRSACHPLLRRCNGASLSAERASAPIPQTPELRARFRLLEVSARSRRSRSRAERHATTCLYPSPFRTGARRWSCCFRTGCPEKLSSFLLRTKASRTR